MILRDEAHLPGSLSQSLIRIAESLESQLGSELLAQAADPENPETRALKVLQRDTSSSIMQNV